MSLEEMVQKARMNSLGKNELNFGEKREIKKKAKQYEKADNYDQAAMQYFILGDTRKGTTMVRKQCERLVSNGNYTEAAFGYHSIEDQRSALATIEKMEAEGKFFGESFKLRDVGKAYLDIGETETAREYAGKLEEMDGIDQAIELYNLLEDENKTMELIKGFETKEELKSLKEAVRYYLEFDKRDDATRVAEKILAMVDNSDYGTVTLCLPAIGVYEKYEEKEKMLEIAQILEKHEEWHYAGTTYDKAGNEKKAIEMGDQITNFSDAEVFFTKIGAHDKVSEVWKREKEHRRKHGIC